MTTPLPPSSPVEYVPLTPDAIQALRLKAERNELTAEDTRAFILSTRAAFTAVPAAKKSTTRVKAESVAATKLPPAKTVDFF